MSRILISGLLLVLLAGSCRTLPNVTSFVDASSQLRKGVKSGLDAVNTSLLSDDIGSRDLKDDEKKLKELSVVMDKSLLGITAYAGALNSLVEAGNSGEKNASQVANSLTQIIEQVAPAPISAIVGVTGESLAKISGQIAKVRAAKKLGPIMDEATPAIVDIRLVFSKIIGKLIEYNKAVYRNKKNALLAPNTLNKNIIDYEDYLNKEQIKLYEKLAIISDYKSSTVKDFENLKKQIDFIKEEKDVERRQTELVEQSRRIDAEKQRIAPLTDRVRSTDKNIIDQYNAIDQLFRTSNDALISWSKAHADIRQQLTQKTTPNFQELLEIVDDLKELRTKIKSLNP